VVFLALNWTGRDWAAYIDALNFATINIPFPLMSSLKPSSMSLGTVKYAGWEFIAKNESSERKVKYTIVPPNLHF